MKRLNTFNHEIGDTEYKLPKTPNTPYIVDDSNFIPMSEAVKQLGAANFNGETYKGAFDFADGKDTGIAIPITRTKDGKDIAEVSSAIMDKVDEISEEMKKARDFEQFKAETEQKMNSSRPATSE